MRSRQYSDDGKADSSVEVLTQPSSHLRALRCKARLLPMLPPPPDVSVIAANELPSPRTLLELSETFFCRLPGGEGGGGEMADLTAASGGLRCSFSLGLIAQIFMVGGGLLCPSRSFRVASKPPTNTLTVGIGGDDCCCRSALVFDRGNRLES